MHSVCYRLIIIAEEGHNYVFVAVAAAKKILFFLKIFALMKYTHFEIMKLENE